MRRNDQAWGWYSEGKTGWIGAYSGDIQPVEGSQVIVASIGDYWSTELMRTEDAGQHWELVTEDAEHHLFVAFHPDDPQLAYPLSKRGSIQLVRRHAAAPRVEHISQHLGRKHQLEAHHHFHVRGAIAVLG